MYQVDERDSVSELHDVPRADIGGPLVTVVASEDRLDLVRLVARIRFERPYAHMFRPPNDEAFSGHPLAARGVAPYRVWEVRDSSWLRSLGHMNSVHPYHSHERFADLRHFLFAFHDTTFECIARRYDCHVERSSVAAVMAATALAGHDVV